MQVDPVLQAHRSLVVGVAAVAPLVASAALSLLRDSVANTNAARGLVLNTNAALGLVLLVVVAASTGIRAAGIAAALSSAAWFDYFLTEPYNQFAITDAADIETAVLLMLVGVAVAEVALWGRRQQARASREQGYLDGVLNTAATVGAGRVSVSSLIDRVCDQIVDILQIDRCRFDLGGEPVLAALDNDGAVTYNGHEYNVARLGLPTDTEVALVAQSGGVIRGRFLLTAATRIARPSQEQLRVAAALADRVGAAIAAPNLNGSSPRSTG